MVVSVILLVAVAASATAPSPSRPGSTEPRAVAGGVTTEPRALASGVSTEPRALASGFRGAAAAAPSFDELAKQAAAARQSNRTSDAVKLYRQCVRLRPSWAEGWWYLGSLLYDGNSFEGARDALARFVQLEPKAAPGLALLGLSEFGTKQYAESLDHLQRALFLRYNDGGQMWRVARYHAGLLLTRSGEFEAALRYFSQLAVLGVDTPQTILATGLAGLRMPIFPDELEPSKREFVREVGRALFHAGARNVAETERAFRELLAAYPNAPEIHYLYGSYLLASDAEAAMRELLQELEISPRHVPARVILAFEYLKRGDPAAGLPYARDAVKFGPASFTAHNALGRTLVEVGDVPGGVAELETARKLAPDSPETRIALASAYAKAGRRADAERERAESARLQKLREAIPR